MNGALIGGNGNASPTSNLYPSITSLFQSPIGTPRVTPTPQFTYLFNDQFNDQYHLIFQNTASTFPSVNTNMNSSTSSAQMNHNDTVAFFDSVLMSNLSCQPSSSSATSTSSTVAAAAAAVAAVAASNITNSSESPLPLFSNLISNSLSSSNIGTNSIDSANSTNLTHSNIQSSELGEKA
jgi:hypothetical protein